MGHKTPFSKGGEQKTLFNVGQYPLFQKPSILLIPQQHTPPKDFPLSPFQPPNPFHWKEKQVINAEKKWPIKAETKWQIKAENERAC